MRLGEHVLHLVFSSFPASKQARSKSATRLLMCGVVSGFKSEAVYISVLVPDVLWFLSLTIVFDGVNTNVSGSVVFVRCCCYKALAQQRCAVPYLVGSTCMQSIV